MHFAEFKMSLDSNSPLPGLSRGLEALWYDAKGNWNKAHQLAQEFNTPTHCLIHAYLHRKEGDTRNAQYWYTRAGRKMPAVSLEQEWEQIAKELLQ
jgi:hypothetical protein